MCLLNLRNNDSYHWQKCICKILKNLQIFSSQDGIITKIFSNYLFFIHWNIRLCNRITVECKRVCWLQVFLWIFNELNFLGNLEELIQGIWILKKCQFFFKLKFIQCYDKEWLFNNFNHFSLHSFYKKTYFKQPATVILLQSLILQ